MNEQIANKIISALNARAITGTELIQNLWSGYGKLLRVTTDNGSIIVKLIQFPDQRSHPRGWSSDIGHERKKNSYLVEQNWYRELQPIDGARMATLLDCGEVDAGKYLILEDLTAADFHIKHDIDWPEITLCLQWLAHFHRHYLNHRPDGLWKIGTYWHLDTRPEELEVLTDTELKQAAPLIDARLNNARHQSIVHGDAKLANFMFNDRQVAAVDFQYVGGGVGVKDLAYFMSSIFHEDELDSYESRCLDTYFKFLNLPQVEQEWRTLYPVAWCDFYRFLKGWSPGHWKINTYSERMKQMALECL